MILQAMTPWAQERMANGERNIFPQGIEICSVSKSGADQAPPAGPGQPDRRHGCAMCLAHPVAASAICGAIAEVQAPDFAVFCRMTIPRTSLVSATSPKIRTARAPPLSRV
jgi:hypothetical protein